MPRACESNVETLQLGLNDSMFDRVAQLRINHTPLLRGSRRRFEEVVQQNVVEL